MNTDRLIPLAVIGAGTMGPGMAAICASHGCQVRLHDTRPEALERARATVKTIYTVLSEEGSLTAEQVEQGHSQLEYTLDLAHALAGAEFVIESVPEQAEIKQAVFRALEDHVSDTTILASNTSGIPIGRLAEVCRHPERVVGMHWSNPPHIIPVIEVVCAAQTAPETVAATHALAERLGMLPVTVQRDVPGFVENRILYAIMREALHLLDTGVASAEAIDAIVKWGVGFKLSVIPPLELLDVAGLDIYDSVARYLNADLNGSAAVSPTIGERVARGELGIKTGKGLFEYQPQELPGLVRRRMRLLLDVKKALTPEAPAEA
jgi:3-hydroxybutyryl-CoA dehydrogenase/5-formyl-3-hydroxy-2-methylpyridine 4-carboxylate dehydrogenase